MKVTVDMPPIRSCDASQCAFNAGDMCHARAITVGDGETPHCDTYFRHDPHVRDVHRTAGVGACKVSQCVYNDDYECIADAVDVGSRNGEVYCLSFRAKE